MRVRGGATVSRLGASTVSGSARGVAPKSLLKMRSRGALPQAASRHGDRSRSESARRVGMARRTLGVDRRLGPTCGHLAKGPALPCLTQKAAHGLGQLARAFFLRRVSAAQQLEARPADLARHALAHARR